MSRLRHHLRAWAIRFGMDRRGVAALEFALLAPILIVLYFGMAELVQVMMVQRRVSHAAAAVGDLVAQYATLSNDDKDNVFTAATNILAPFPDAKLNLRVTSVSGNAQGKPRVDWSDGEGSLPSLNHCDTPANFPTGLITAAGDNVVVAEASYTYDSFLASILPNKQAWYAKSSVPTTGLTFNERFFLRPRKAAKVGRQGEVTSPAC